MLKQKHSVKSVILCGGHLVVASKKKCLQMTGMQFMNSSMQFMGSSNSGII